MALKEALQLQKTNSVSDFGNYKNVLILLQVKWTDLN